MKELIMILSIVGIMVAVVVSFIFFKKFDFCPKCGKLALKRTCVEIEGYEGQQQPTFYHWRHLLERNTYLRCLFCDLDKLIESVPRYNWYC